MKACPECSTAFVRDVERCPVCVGCDGAATPVEVDDAPRVVRPTIHERDRFREYVRGTSFEVADRLKKGNASREVERAAREVSRALELSLDLPDPMVRRAARGFVVLYRLAQRRAMELSAHD